MVYRLVAVAAVFAAGAVAECPNGCSTHGLCKEKDQCLCDPGYFGADCSLRVCPYDYAFVDVPAGDLNHDGVVGNSYVNLELPGNKNAGTGNVAAYEMFPTDATLGNFAAQNNEAHFYMECSGKGSCDRAAGECKCFTGYTGSACQRSTCPNDCNGNGICRTLKEVAAGALSRRAVGSQGGNLLLAGVRTPFDYSLWDADKHQMCVCDPGFDGVDCSLRTCPRGDDPITPAKPRWCGGKPCVSEVQEFRLSSAGPTTYRFKFVDTRNNTLVGYATIDTTGGAPGYVNNSATDLAHPSTNAGKIMDALRTIPGGILQFVEVQALNASPNQAGGRTFQVTFAGLSGDQYLLTVEPTTGKGTVEVAPHEVTKGNTEDIECSGRGLCDRDTGNCKCFPGYYGSSCSYLNALANQPATSAAAAKTA